MKFQKYTKYKASGVDWLGEIPEEWEENHLKRNCVKITDGAHTSPDLSSRDYPFLSTVDLKDRLLDFNNCLYTSKIDYKVLLNNGCNPIKNDVLFSKDGTIGETTYITENKKFVVGSSLVIIRPKIKIFNPNYMSYCLGSFLINSQARSYVKGSGLPRISIFNVAKLFIPLPPKQTQTKLANYLDEKTNLIDKKISLLQKKKQKYKELKQTLINEVVTKGLDNNVKMKESEIKWIGEIPKHWEVKRLKDISNNIYAGGTPSTIKEDYWNRNDYIWLPSGELQNNIIRKHKNNKYISNSGLNNSSTKLIAPQTTLIALTGATCANIGYLTFEACANQSVVAIASNKKYYSKFLFYYLLIKRNYIKVFQTGGAQAGINTENVKNLLIGTPPKQEQIQIANYLDEKTKKIDDIIEKIDENIEVFKEFRKTLINDAVTGKIKVA